MYVGVLWEHVCDSSHLLIAVFAKYVASCFIEVYLVGTYRWSPETQGDGGVHGT